MAGKGPTWTHAEKLHGIGFTTDHITHVTVAFAVDSNRRILLGSEPRKTLSTHIGREVLE